MQQVVVHGREAAVDVGEDLLHPRPESPDSLACTFPYRSLRAFSEHRQRNTRSQFFVSKYSFSAMFSKRLNVDRLEQLGIVLPAADAAGRQLTTSLALVDVRRRVRRRARAGRR